MLFQNLRNSNTFSQWVSEKQKVVSFVNQITDGYDLIYANTNLFVGEDLHVNGNVVVTGTFILDEVDFDDLTVAGNLTIDQAVSAANGEFLNLNILSNVSSLNVTTDLAVGEDAEFYINLIVPNFTTQNIEIQGTLSLDGTNLTVGSVTVLQNITEANVTNSLVVGTDAYVSQNLNVVQDTSLVNLTSNFITTDEFEVNDSLSVFGNVNLNNVTSVQVINSSQNLVTSSIESTLIDAQNLDLTANLPSLNVTNSLFVGNDAEVYGDLSLSGNLTSETLTTDSFDSTNIVVENLNLTGNTPSLNVTNDLFVGNDAEVYGNLNSSQNLTSDVLVVDNINSSNVDVQNLTLSSNVLSLNVTNNLDVGNDFQVYGNLSSSQNLTSDVITTDNLNSLLVNTQTLILSSNISNLNITSDLYVGNDLQTYGNLNITGNSVLNNVEVNYSNFETANIYSLLGNANTQIYNTIASTTAAVTVAANISSFTAFVLALG